MEINKLKSYFNGLRDATRAEKEQMNQMASTNEAVVELCQQLIEAEIQQGRQITDLIMQVAKITKLLTEKSMKPAGSERSECMAARRYEKCDKCKKVHKKGICWEDEASKAILPANWKSTLK